MEDPGLLDEEPSAENRAHLIVYRATDARAAGKLDATAKRAFEAELAPLLEQMMDTDVELFRFLLAEATSSESPASARA